jgi:hypothetical protein
LEYVDVCQFEFVLLLFGQLDVGTDCLCTAGFITCLDAYLLPRSSSLGRLGAIWVARGQFALLVLRSQLDELFFVDLLEFDLLLLVYRQLLFWRNGLSICLV